MAEDFVTELKGKLSAGEITKDELSLVKDLLSAYAKQEKRFGRVLKQSDKMATEIAEKTDRLKNISVQLSKYLSPQIYDMIFSGKAQASLESSRKKLTLFFSDIVDFTPTTESLEPEELTQLLNHYLTEMSDIALAHGATIDKYIGDAIVIFFGDPESEGYKKDALKCINMAIVMQEKMRELRAKYVDEGIVNNFEIRMGINTGYCTVGNFGSEERMDYTIIGGNVNLAARLEGSAEHSQILISHETYSLVKDNFHTVKKDPIMVKGISKPVQTYQVEGPKDAEGTVFKKSLAGLSIDLNKDHITDRKDAVQILHQAIEELIS
jgi:adenylate cyclase